MSPVLRDRDVREKRVSGGCHVCAAGELPGDGVRGCGARSRVRRVPKPGLVP